MFTNIISLIIGYLLGSISPSFILGKILTGKDIRKKGDKNAGTTNAFKTLSKVPAVITAIYDLGKGLLSMFIAYKLGANDIIIYASGLMAIIGHMFPFYLKFKGGKGLATSIALLLYGLTISILGNWFPYLYLIPLALMVVILYLTVKKGALVAAFILPILISIILVYSPHNALAVFNILLIAHILIINLLFLKDDHYLDFKTKTKIEILRWRAFLRPLAILLVIPYLFLDKKIILIYLGILFIIFFIPDLIRLLSKSANQYFFKKNKKIYKTKERKNFSSMTLFMLGAFLSILLFSQAIAISVILFTVFGDLSAKFVGLQFGRTKIFNKTLEGSTAFFGTCLICGILLSHFLPLSPALIILGAFAAAIAEMINLPINDNIVIPLISGGAMTAIHFFA